jgi:hypothetical protein
LILASRANMGCLDPTPAPSGFLIPQRHLSGLDRFGRFATTKNDIL